MRMLWSDGRRRGHRMQRMRDRRLIDAWEKGFTVFVGVVWGASPTSLRVIVLVIVITINTVGHVA